MTFAFFTLTLTSRLITKYIIIIYLYYNVVYYIIYLNICLNFLQIFKIRQMIKIIVKKANVIYFKREEVLPNG
jgi:hypothetical protein